MKYPTRNCEKILLEKCAFSRRNNMHNVNNIKSNSCQNCPIPAGKTLELCKLVWQEKHPTGIPIQMLLLTISNE
jgi:hypothetical protein